MPTVNCSISPRRNSLPLSSHHNSGTQSSLKKYSKTISKLIVAKLPHHLGENIQRLFRLQKCLSRNSSNSWNYSKTFSPAELCQPQIINLPKVFKDFFVCKIVSAANHQYTGSIQKFPARKQQQSTAATSSSNEQQQPAEATSRSKQQQQPAAATSRSNQQQQPAAATCNNNQHSSINQHSRSHQQLSDMHLHA